MLDAKELLQRSNIRTMKKDLKKLREADVVLERERIRGGEKKTVVPTPADVTAAPIAAQPQIVLTKPIQVPHESKEDLALKPLANENEKQKIFLFNAQKAELKNQFEALTQKKVPLIAEKNSILVEQKNWQTRLVPLIQKAAGAPEHADAMEKQRAPIDQALSKLQADVKTIDVRYNGLVQEENEAIEKLSTIDRTLKEIYTHIQEREEEKKKNTVPPQAPVQKTESVKIEEKPYLKEVLAPVKQKLAESANIENVQRKKFMEDVEAWANSNK